MKKIKIFSLLIVIFGIVSCTKENEKNQDEDNQSLEAQFEEIQNLAASKTCNNGKDWDYVAYGHKACGGPVGYIAYPEKVEKEFLEKIKTYTADQKEYNNRWGIASTCDVPPAPESVDCIDGLPVLVY